MPHGPSLDPIHPPALALAAAGAPSILGAARLAQAVAAWRAWHSDRQALKRLMLAAVSPPVGCDPPRAAAPSRAASGTQRRLARAGYS
jgi:hypothetical protein